MISKEQYELMSIAVNGIKSNRIQDAALDPIRKYLCVYDYIDTYTTSGVKKMPYLYGLNEDGLLEKQKYEKSEERIRAKAAKKTSEKALEKRRFVRDIVAGTIGGLIVLFVQLIVELIIK